MRATTFMKHEHWLKNMCVSLRTCGSALSHFCFICSSLSHNFAASVSFCQYYMIMCEYIVQLSLEILNLDISDVDVDLSLHMIINHT